MKHSVHQLFSSCWIAGVRQFFYSLKESILNFQGRLHDSRSFFHELVIEGAANVTGAEDNVTVVWTSVVDS